MGRQEKIIHYLYKTTCNVTNRYYTGMHSTCNLDDGYMGSGKRLRYSIRKHGIDNHKKEIIKFFETRELLIEGEKEAITPDMIIDKNCMNLKEGGTGGFSSDEHQKKCTAAALTNYLTKIKNDEELFKILCDNLQKNRKKAIDEGKIFDIQSNFDWNGKTHSNETKKLLSDLRQGTGIGNTNSQYGTCWITKDGLNKKIKKEELDKYQQEGWVKGRK